MKVMLIKNPIVLFLVSILYSFNQQKEEIDVDNYVEKFLILKLTTDSLVINNLNYDVEIHLNRRK